MMQKVIYLYILSLLPFFLSAQSDSLKVFDLSKPGTNPTAVKTMSAELLREDFMGSGNVEDWQGAIKAAADFNTAHGIRAYFFATYSTISNVNGIKDIVKSRIDNTVNQEYGTAASYVLINVLQETSEKLNIDVRLRWDQNAPQFQGFKNEMENIEYTLREYANYKLKQCNDNAITTQYTLALFHVLMDELEYQKSISYKHNTGDLVILVNGFWSDNYVSKKLANTVPFNNNPYWMIDLDEASRQKVLDYKPNDTHAIMEIEHMRDFYLPAITDYFNADRLYFVDGGNYSWYTDASTRRLDGKKLALLQDGTQSTSITNLIKTIKSNPEHTSFVDFLIDNGLVQENANIHFITHSMGAAFSEGMIDEMCQSTRVKLGKVIHLSPAESNEITSIAVRPAKPNAPSERVQIISNSDDTVPNKDDSCKKLLDPIDGVDYFANFYEDTTVTNLSRGLIGWGISHATNTRAAVFDVITVLKGLQFNAATPATGQVKCGGLFNNFIQSNLFYIANNNNRNGNPIPFRKVCIGGTCYKINNFPGGEPNAGKYATTECDCYGINNIHNTGGEGVK